MVGHVGLAAEFNKDFAFASHGRSLSSGWPGLSATGLVASAFVSLLLFVCFDGCLNGSQMVHSLNRGGCSPLSRVLLIIIEALEDRVELRGTWCGLRAIEIAAAAFFFSLRVASL